jgi:amidase
VSNECKVVKEDLVPIPRPTPEELRATGEDVGLLLSHEDIAFFSNVMDRGLATYDTLDAMSGDPGVPTSERSYSWPSPDENRNGAWSCRSRIVAGDGVLTGRTVAVKDNICVAGVPMANGTAYFDGYVPDLDAIVASRVLNAGGTIVGKTTCECLCFSSCSHTAAAGLVHNPLKHWYSTGGSSSGSAAVVAAREVDMAIGTDSAGSIRIPAALCGVYGMKPTHDLVPFAGILGMDATIDHAGPITANVADNASLLEVLAGGGSIEQQMPPHATNYTEALGRTITGMRIAIVREGFGHPQSNQELDKKVMSAAALLHDLGAHVDRVSIPAHRLGPALWRAISLEGSFANVFQDNGVGAQWSGRYPTHLSSVMARWREHANRLPDTVKSVLLLGKYVSSHSRGFYYGKARNLAHWLRAAYDQVLADYDLLLMPTVPFPAPPLPRLDQPRDLALRQSIELLANTAPFNVSHHPVMTLPCGLIDELPVGVTLVGRHHGEPMIYRAASAFEQAIDWRDR